MTSPLNEKLNSALENFEKNDVDPDPLCVVGLPIGKTHAAHRQQNTRFFKTGNLRRVRTHGYRLACALS